MDFSKLSRPSTLRKAIDPITIFEKLPNLAGKPNDLWRGQADALKEWHSNRAKKDALISLHTGAGKTLIGLLIAQSLHNENGENVVYACSTIDLVNQTKKEAEKIGIDVTTRTESDFDNDLFETGKAFCITTYAALFNGFSVFSRKYPPSAIIFDDAHVAEKLLRDAFTINLLEDKHPALFSQILNLFRPAFEKEGKGISLKDTVAGQSGMVLMAPPASAFLMKDEISRTFEQQKPSFKDSPLIFPYQHLKENLANCAFLFSKGQIEVAPPFIPVFSLPYFSNATRRVYLSATLNYKADFIRAFGKNPDITVSPFNDAGTGERLVLFASMFKDKAVKEELADAILKENKLLISVPFKYKAEAWKKYGEPPSQRQFSEKLEEFRKSKKGSFVLVSRIDGIDLPHDTCRVMIIDDLPTGASLVEKFQHERLSMANFLASKLANRLTQQFGRIIRGRNDYGVFILNGRDLNTWLKNDRKNALLPELLRKQILLGQHIQTEQGQLSTKDITSLISKVLGRDRGWISYYSDSIEEMKIDAETIKKAEDLENALTVAAEDEVRFICSLWEDDLDTARNALEKNIDSLNRADNKLAGWHRAWIGSIYERQYDIPSASIEYEKSKKLLNRQIMLPKYIETFEPQHEPTKNIACFEAIYSVVTLPHEKFEFEMGKIDRALSGLADKTLSSNIHEEFVRELGQRLGYTSIRPDNDFSKGPDVLWVNEENKTVLGIELKTKKLAPVQYKKEDIGILCQHIEWIHEEYKHYNLLGMIVLGPEGTCTNNSNPTDDMYLADLEKFKAAADMILAFYRDTSRFTPLEKIERVKKFVTGDGEMEAILKLLLPRPMLKLRVA